MDGWMVQRKEFCYAVIGGWKERWNIWEFANTEQEAQVELAKLALQYGGQWRIVKEE